MIDKNIFQEGIHYKRIKREPLMIRLWLAFCGKPYQKYKYQLLKNVWIQTHIFGECIRHRYFEVFPDGSIVLRAGYCSDGASGPTWDTPSSMRGAFVHDAIYQMLREGLFFQEKPWSQKRHDKLRKKGDEVIRTCCIVDDMWRIRAHAWYRSLRICGAKHAKRGKTA